MPLPLNPLSLFKRRIYFHRHMSPSSLFPLFLPRDTGLKRAIIVVVIVSVHISSKLRFYEFFSRISKNLTFLSSLPPNLWNNVPCLFFLSFLWGEGLVKVEQRGEMEEGSGIVAWWPQAISSWVAAEKKVAYFNWRNPPPPYHTCLWLGRQVMEWLELLPRFFM